jgi:cytochrome b subunit of formate dehydrogenase
MSSKVKINYALDAAIAFAFILTAVSGVVFLFLGSGGYQGGRNPGFRAEVLGIARSTWSDLHVWVGLVMIAGILVHLLLHWQWIVCVTQRMLRSARRPIQEVCPIE